MNRCETVFGNDAFGNENRILEVVAVPGHKRDQHILPKRQLSLVGRRTVGDHIALRDGVADANQRSLIDIGVLIGTCVFHQIVNVDTDFARNGLVVIDPDNNARRIRVVNLAAAQSLNRST